MRINTIKPPYYLLFFSYNILIATIIYNAQQFICNTSQLGASIIWMTLLIGMPIGASIYVRYKLLLQKHLPTLSTLSLMWVYLSEGIFIKLKVRQFTFPVSYTQQQITSFLENTFIIELMSAIITFFPLWIAIGMLELSLFNTIKALPKKNIIKAYTCGILGLSSFLVCVTLFNINTHPSLIGLFTCSLLLVMFGYPIKTKNWRFYLSIICTLLLMTQTQHYLFSFSNDQTLSHFWERSTPNQSPTVHVDNWSPFYRLTLLEKNNILFGSYNNLIHWFTYNPIDPHQEIHSSFLKLNTLKVPLHDLLPVNSTQLIIGSGGGSQIPELRLSNPKQIIAIDLIPKLNELISSLGYKTYESNNISYKAINGRVFLENTSTLFNLIYFPFTEINIKIGHLSIEPSDTLFTLEAFKQYAKKLHPDGILLIKKVTFFEPWSHFLTPLTNTLTKAGYFTTILQDPLSYILFASPSLKKHYEINAYFQDKKISVTNPIYDNSIPLITDNNPFQNHLWKLPKSLIITIASILLLLLLLLLIFFSKTRSLLLITTATLTGMNYSNLLLIFPLLLILKSNNPLYTHYYGGLIFLGLIMLGLILSHIKKIPALLIMALLISILTQQNGLLCCALCTLVSANFFPKLVTYFKHDLASLFIYDAFGALCSSIGVLIITQEYGTNVIIIITTTTCLLTIGLHLWANKNIGKSQLIRSS